MAEVLYDHREDALTCYDHDAGWCCVCGEHDIDATWRDHMAAALAAAGYGPVKEAQAGALREAADLVEPFSGIGMANGATRGEVAAWLRARAAAIEAGQ